MKGNLVFYTGLSKAPALTRIAPAIAPAFSKRSALQRCIALCCFWPLRAAIGPLLTTEIPS